MTIKAIKLVSGEELVAEVLHESVDETTLEVKEITIQNPLAIMIQRAPTGDLNVLLIPFAPYLGRHPTITFPMNRIIFMVEVDEQMRNQYNTVFGGVVTPPKQLIVG